MKNYSGQLKLMDVPRVAKSVKLHPRTVCEYCGNFNSNGGLAPVYVNGLRINPKHKSCVKSANKPLFDMDSLLKKSG